METKKRALGMGLEQLFNNERLDISQLESHIVDNTDKNDIVEIDVNEIRSNPHQPRRYFDEDSLQELSESIKVNGVIQPIIVKKSIKGYEIVAGERRCRASKLAGNKTIPAIIKDFSDEEMMEIALLENIQREDLSAIEEAEGYSKMIRARGLTQEELAKRLGKTRTHVTNTLGLLRLPDNVKELINNKNISMSHARILSKLFDENQIQQLSLRIVNEGLSVYELESLVKNEESPKLIKNTPHKNRYRPYGVYEDALRERLGVKALISNYKITIPFTSKEKLIDILEMLKVEIDD